MRVTELPISYILVAWLGAGAVRILLGSSPPFVADLSFYIFWLISIALFIAAIMRLVVSKRREEKVEAISICVGLVSFLTQGALGNQHTTRISLIVFLVSAGALMYLYSRRLLRRYRPLRP